MLRCVTAGKLRMNIDVRPLQTKLFDRPSPGDIHGSQDDRQPKQRDQQRVHHHQPNKHDQRTDQLQRIRLGVAPRRLPPPAPAVPHDRAPIRHQRDTRVQRCAQLSSLDQSSKGGPAVRRQSYLAAAHAWATTEAVAGDRIGPLSVTWTGHPTAPNRCQGFKTVATHPGNLARRSLRTVDLAITEKWGYSRRPPYSSIL